MLKKVVIIGPESTGKSSLCEQLAEHYKTNWVPEYAREYLLKNGTNYNYDDLLVIAKGQLEQESRITHAASRITFIDTDMYVMKVWCEFVFNKCHRFILDAITERKYDLYLLCNTDLPWVRDELREYPDPEFRKKLFHMYKDILVNTDTPWVEISGTDSQRIQTAFSVIKTVFGK